MQRGFAAGRKFTLPVPDLVFWKHKREFNRFYITPKGEMVLVLDHDDVSDRIVDELLVPKYPDAFDELREATGMLHLGRHNKSTMTAMGFVRGQFDPETGDENDPTLNELLFEIETPLSSAAEQTIKDLLAFEPNTVRYDVNNTVRGSDLRDFQKLIVRSLEERGGEGSGHHGHRGRPGKVGGSLPGKGISNLRFQVRPIGGEVTLVDGLEEAVAMGGGRVEYIDPYRKMWALYMWSDELEDRGFSLDEIDLAREIEIALEVHDYFLELINNPANAKAIEAMDRDGDQLLRIVQKWMEEREGFDIDNPFLRRQYGPSMNIVLTNNDDRVGAGSSQTGTKAAKVFWQPVTLDPEKQVLQADRGTFAFTGSPIYVLVHEMHHGFGSGSELDPFSSVVAADFYLNNRDYMTPGLEKGMLTELAQTLSGGQRRAAGEFKEYTLRDRAAMGWLYSRHSDYFDTIMDSYQTYWDTGDHSYEPARGWFVKTDIDAQRKKLAQWAKEFGA